MTAITHDHGHTAIWRRTTRALGKFWAKMIALPDASTRTRYKTPTSEYFNFPPF